MLLDCAEGVGTASTLVASFMGRIHDAELLDEYFKDLSRFESASDLKKR